MKRMSIKLKVTLYFTVIMSIIACALLFYVASIARNVARNELYDRAVTGVNNLYEELHFSKNNDGFKPPMAQPRPEGNKKPPEDNKESALEIPENAVFKDGDVYVYILQVAEDNEEITHHGELPEGLEFNPADAKSDGKIILPANEGKYYVYSKFLRDPAVKDGGAWVVGAISTHLTNSVVFGTLRTAALSLPVIVLLAALLGYVITKRAFRPVAEITATAAEISGSNDLSRRINLGNGKDEISKLAQTFDGMLDAIQRNYEKEKQFTDDASHELRTPVAIIMAQSELALESKATEVDIREAVSIINNQSHKMKMMLSELLSLARADNNRTVLEKEEFDLRELAELIADDQQFIADERDIKISLTKGDSVHVFADRTSIMRVLLNLTSNAIKYGKEGGNIIISIEKTADGKACCKVKDDGVGIAEEHLPRIWDRFYRVNTSRTEEKCYSVGLGLSIVKSIIDAHGGEVTVESTLGSGSVFGFVI